MTLEEKQVDFGEKTRIVREPDVNHLNRLICMTGFHVIDKLFRSEYEIYGIGEINYLRRVAYEWEKI